MNRRSFLAIGLAVLRGIPQLATASTALANRKFVFKIKTKSGGIVGNILIEAKDIAHNVGRAVPCIRRAETLPW